MRCDVKKHRVIRFIGRAIFIMFLTGILGCVFLLSYLMGIDEWKSFDPADVAAMDENLVLYDASGKEYANLQGSENRIYVELETIPEHILQAFIAIEDTRFYEHSGIDVIRIGGALLEDIRSGGIVEGASTISQQVVKNYGLTSDQTITRKLAEIMMAFKLEGHYTKDEILELYLNTVYFGNGAYGIQTAATTYFSCSASELTLTQAASLAAILKSPTYYAPHLYPEENKERRALVLNAMFEAGFISEKELEVSKNEELVLVETEMNEYPYGYFTDMVLNDTSKLTGLSIEELLTGGYEIYTTLDTQIQQELQELASDDTMFPPDAEDGLQVECATVVIDPQTGHIKGLLGGREHEVRLGFNRAIAMRRQPGSAIKPILVFAPAIEYLDYSTTSILFDEQENFGGYMPRNSGSNYRGWVTLRDTVAYSINIPAVRLLNEIGVERAKGYASSVGIPFEEKDNNLSLALGGFTTGVTPLELAGSYIPFASGGYYRKPTAVEYVKDKDGNVIYSSPTQAYSVLSEESAFLMNSLLASGVDYGTATALNIEDIELCAKTGTSTYDDASNNKDAWVVAYNSDYIVCTWMGFDVTDEEHSLQQGITGGTYPAEFAAEIISSIYNEKSAPEFLVPDGIVECEIDAELLEDSFETYLAGAFSTSSLTEYFTQKSAPTKTSDYYNTVPPDDFKVEKSVSGLPTISFTPINKMEYELWRFNEVDDDGELIDIILGSDEEIIYTDITAKEGENYVYRLIINTAVLSESEGYISAPSVAFAYEYPAE